MDIFPTQYSTLLASALQPVIEKKYLIKINALRLLIRNVSDTYIIEAVDKKYIFKIYRKPYRTLGEISAEVELLNILKDNGANVSFPIRDAEGNQIQQFNAAEGIRYGVLYSFALGTVVENLDNSQLSILGKEMALIHNVTSTKDLKLDRITYNEHTTIDKPLILIQQRFSELPTEYSFLSKTAEQVKEKMSKFDLTKFNYGYCHFDFLPKNFHFDENNNITIFDFDWMGKGFLVNDHMTFL